MSRGSAGDYQADERYETRGWPYFFVGWVAIQGAKRWTADQRETCMEEPFYSALFPPGVKRGDVWARPELWPPLGAILGVAYLEACVQTTDPMLQAFLSLHPKERQFGDFYPGRYALRFVDHRPLPTAIPFSAQQGLFRLSPDIAAQCWTNAIHPLG